MNVCNDFNPIRKYVQFNDWVFDSYDTVRKGELKVGTKTKTHEYGFGHGSYLAAKQETQFLTEADLSLSIDIDYGLYRKEDRKYVLNHINNNILKVGKLWAIQDDKLMWAHAFVDDISETYERWKQHYTVDVDFILPEGLWHIADLTEVYLLPYDACELSEKNEYQDVDPCSDLDCCASCSTEYEETCAKCIEDCLTPENNACVMLSGSNRNEVFNSFLNCGKSYRIVMNCNKSLDLDGKNLGTKICKDGYCKSAIAGKFYSDTYSDTTMVSFTLSGHWQDPIININGTRLMIKGEYDGTLRMDESGNVTFQQDECCPEVNIALDDVQWIDDEFLFTVHQGMNRLIVEGSCCEMGCIYIKTDSIAY